VNKLQGVGALARGDERVGGAVKALGTEATEQGFQVKARVLKENGGGGG
jgi:hypothetical protein